MNRLKTILAALLYLGSLATLLTTAAVVSRVLDAYGRDHPATLGRGAPPSPRPR